MFQLSPSPLGGRGGAQAGGGPMSGMRPIFRLILLTPPEELEELLKLAAVGISSGGLKKTVLLVTINIPLFFHCQHQFSTVHEH